VMTCSVGAAVTLSTNWVVKSFTSSDAGKLTGPVTIAAEGEPLRRASAGAMSGAAATVYDQLFLGLAGGPSGVMLLTEDGPLLGGSVIDHKGRQSDVAFRKLPTTSGIYQVESTSDDRLEIAAGAQLKLEPSKVKLEGAMETYLVEFDVGGKRLNGVAVDVPPNRFVVYGTTSARLFKLVGDDATRAGPWVGAGNTAGTIALTR
jgi:hypothetical protein